MYTYSYSDLKRHQDAFHEISRDIQIAENNEEYDLADHFRGELNQIRFYIAEFKNAGICEEFPAGEFAVVGVNVPVHGDW